MSARVDTCPFEGCNAKVLICDNGLRLDHPAKRFSAKTARWIVVPLDTLEVAAERDEAPEDGKGYGLHEHQVHDDHEQQLAAREDQ